LAAPGSEPNAHDGHSVPPQPHFATRISAAGQSHFESQTTAEPEFGQASHPQSGLPEKPVPVRSLASPGVIVSLLASVAVMCAIGWYEKHGIEGFKWDTITTFVQRLSIEPADPEGDLPFITAIPMTLNSNGADSIAKIEPSSAKKTNQVLLSDLLKDEAAGTSDDDRTQLR
jgi:hypothetical protein